MSPDPNTVSVLTPYAPEPFSYAFSDSSIPTPGTFVHVNLRGRDVVGVVWDKTNLPLIPASRLKNAEPIPLLKPLPPSFILYLKRAQAYTMGSLGQWLRLAIPSPQLLSQPKKQTTKKSPSLILNNPPHPQKISQIQLNTEQRTIANNLQRIASESQFSPILLEGITGSGKTETYFSLVQHTLAQKKQTLILLPEILLAEQTFLRAQAFFSHNIALWHSEITLAQRRHIWQQWQKGELPILIGTRSALHLPCPHLATIIIDEEHDNGYKQEEGGAIYHARDIAVLRAQCTQATIILSSATPSLETIHNVQTKRYQHFSLKKRFGKASLPSVSLCDMNDTLVSAPKNLISQPLKEKILSRLQLQQQSLLFLNRRGYAPVVLCHSCGQPLLCPQDEHILALHLHTQKSQKLLDGIFFSTPTNSHPFEKNIPPNTQLLCHLCGNQHTLPSQCPHCRKPSSFFPKGWGVERIASEVASFAPNARIAIATSDTLSKKNQLKKFLEHMHNNQIHIVIGTQLIAKGLHFPSLTLVGIIDALQGFTGIDFRNNERCFQMTHQVSGRSGRDPLLKGEVLIQSHQTNSPLIQALQNINDPNAQQQFIHHELSIRESASLPPYSFYAAFILSSSHLELLESTCRQLYKNAPSAHHITLFPPIPAPIPFVRKNYRFRFLIKSKRPHHPQPFIAKWLQNASIPSRVNLHIDIDPVSFL